MAKVHWLDWPAPKNIRACYTLRTGGHSHAPFNSFNLAQHVGDTPQHVDKNRELLAEAIGQIPIAWLQQIHSTEVVPAEIHTVLTADANVTRQNNLACCVMTADCLPVFFCDTQGEQVAMAHAGWRGLSQGVLQRTLASFSNPTEVLVYLGPAISQQAFEVGDDVREAFLSQRHLSLNKAHALSLTHCFKPGEQAGKWMADLYGLARRLLHGAGVETIYGGDRCTFTENNHFFSYRRDGQTGRMANLIWKV